MNIYNIIIKKQAKKRLKSLPVGTRTKIASAIFMLGNNPEDVRLDIKKLQGEGGYRMRVGQWRVIFDRDDEVKIISIERVGPRGDVYK